MFEYQTTVSLSGRFLFRTDWDNDSMRATRAYEALIARFTQPDFKVTCYKREPSMTVCASNVEG